MPAILLLRTMMTLHHAHDGQEELQHVEDLMRELYRTITTPHHQVPQPPELRPLPKALHYNLILWLL
jgi:hypothetical protein